MNFLRLLVLGLLGSLFVAGSGLAARPAIPEVIVKLRPGPDLVIPAADQARVGRPELDAALQRVGARLVTRAFPASARSNMAVRQAHGLDRYIRVQLPAGTDPERAAAELRLDPDVETVTYDAAMRLTDAGASSAAVELVPNDPSFELQWSFRNTGANAGVPITLTSDADIDATDAWSTTTGSSSVTVALLSSGIDFSEPELAGRFWQNSVEAGGLAGIDDDNNGYIDDIQGWDWLEGDNNPNKVPDDPGNPNQLSLDVGATRAASTVGANGNNAAVLAGVDWNCRFMPLRIISGTFGASITDLAASILYAAENGADILLSVVTWSSPVPENLAPLHDAIAAAQSMGTLVIAPVGNSGDDSNALLYPAANDGVIGVGSTEGQDLHCNVARCGHYSYTGSHVDLVAPGRRIPIINVVASGPSTIITAAGTTFAAPHVAGAAALVMGANPSLTAAEVADILTSTADDQVGDPAQDVAGRDDFHGYGRLNVARAVQLAVNVAPVVTAPATVSGTEGSAIAFTVTAGDADGDAVTSLTAAGVPSGATFTAAPDNSSGDFSWTPATGQAGSYPVTFHAVSGINGLTGSAATTIDVAPANLPPVVIAPATISSPAGLTINFDVTATDPEGEAIEQLVMSGLVKGMGFSTSGLGTPTATGTFTWTPMTPTTASLTFTASTDCATLPCQGSATTAITVTTGGPTLSLQAAYSVSESAGAAVITVSRTISSVGTLTVDYATVDGTALAGTDYTAVSGTLTFPDGSLASQSFTVPIQDDLVKTGDRSFTVTLTNPTGGAVINRSSAPVGILENDWTRGTIGFVAADFPVNENAGSVTVTVARTGGSDGATTINYATDEGFYSEAFDGYHYTGVSGTLTWADGDASSKTFTVPILDNADAEGNLRFRVTLGGFGLGEASPGLTSASVTILDDEAAPAPVLTVTPLSHDFGSLELGASGTVAVTLQNTGSGTLTVALPTLTAGAAEGFSLSGAAPVGLAAGASASFSANFQPAALGAAAGSISITSDGGSATVALSGTGVDTTAPSVAVTNPAGGESYAAGASVLIEWTASDNHQLQSFDLEYSTDGGATFPNAIATMGGADRSFSWTVPSLAADASAAIRITAHDASANTQAATSNLFTILRLDTPATIDAIADVTVAEGSTATVPVHASDAEGDLISLTAALPGFGALNAPTSGAGDLSTDITLAPGFSDAGSYSAAVSEAGGASVTFGITVSNTDQGLVLTAPASLSASERSLLTVDVSASDPDGEPVTSLTADLSGLPAGNDASFSIVGAALPAVLAEGRLTWTPDCQMAGSYAVSFSAVSGNTATAATTIDVANVGTAPAITPIADQTVAEGSVQGVPVTANDADGDPIMLAATLPAFGSFVDNGGGNGNITLSPGYEDAGSYSAEVTASESCDGSTTATFGITVTNTDRPVTLAAAANESASEGIPFSMTVLAHDEDGDAITLTADLAGLPAGNDAEFSDAAINVLEREGTLSWTPTYDDAGSYSVSFTATAGPASASATTTIAVANVNRAPMVTAPATQTVNENALLAFSISATDPDGAGVPLTLTADLTGLPAGPTFTDNSDNTGSFDWTPTYSDAGGSPYFAIFTATDGSDVGSATTQITVLDVASATAFPTSKGALRLGAGKPNYFVAIEPAGGSFLLTDVDWTTVRMNSTGTGTVSSIAIDASKPVVVGDQDGNAVDDATVNFTKTDLRNLFAFVSGRQMVPVTITGTLTGGTTFIASMTIEVIGTGGALAASVSPNPLNPEAVLTFHVAKAGRVTVGLYDARGRLVRRVVSGDEMSRGWHDLRLDGRSDDGRTLTSGVYFYRIDTQENSISGRLTVLK